MCVCVWMWKVATLRKDYLDTWEEPTASFQAIAESLTTNIDPDGATKLEAIFFRRDNSLKHVAAINRGIQAEGLMTKRYIYIYVEDEDDVENYYWDYYYYNYIIIFIPCHKLLRLSDGVLFEHPFTGVLATPVLRNVGTQSLLINADYQAVSARTDITCEMEFSNGSVFRVIIELKHTNSV